MRKYICVALLFGHLFFILGHASTNIGKIPPPQTTPYTPWFLFQLLAFMAYPAVLGYFIGKDNK